VGRYLPLRWLAGWLLGVVWVLAFWVGFDESVGMLNNSDDALFEIAGDDAVDPVRVPVGRSKVFRSYDSDQSFVMPPSLDQLYPSPTRRSRLSSRWQPPWKLRMALSSLSI